MDVKNLKVTKEGRQVYFDALIQEDALSDYAWGSYKTAEDGAGLWVWCGYQNGWRQIAGTCDICFRQKSKSGLYKAFKRYCGC